MFFSFSVDKNVIHKVVILLQYQLNQLAGLTQNSEAVVYRNDDNVSVAGEDAAVNHVAGSFHVGSAVDVNHDRL